MLNLRLARKALNLSPASLPLVEASTEAQVGAVPANSAPLRDEIEDWDHRCTRARRPYRHPCHQRAH